MKKQIFAFAMVLCLMTGTSAFAQKSEAAPQLKQMPTVEQMAQKKTERMTRELKLTDVQAKKIYDINLNEIKTMQTVRSQMREARTAEAEQMKSILNTEQFVKWAQMQDGPGRDDKHGIHPMRKGKGNKSNKVCSKHSDKPCPMKDKE